jgi:hypothetical protein
VFVDKHGVLIQDEVITVLPAYMLVKLKHDIGIDVYLPGLPPLVVGIEPSSTTYYGGNGKNATILQFPAVLGYVITDFKCQSQTFSNVIVDIKQPSGRGKSPVASPYIPLPSEIDNITIDLFNITLKEDCAIDSVAVHSANIALTNNEPLNTQIYETID